jgi:antitoxin CptB
MTDPYAKLRWRCRRGMRELDAVLQAFLDRGFGTLDEADKARFETLLDLPDPVLHGYLVGRHEPEDPDTVRLIERIRQSLNVEP